MGREVEGSGADGEGIERQGGCKGWQGCGESGKGEGEYKSLVIININCRLV